MVADDRGARADCRVDDWRRSSGGASRELWSFDAVVGVRPARPLVLRRDPRAWRTRRPRPRVGGAAGRPAAGVAGAGAAVGADAGRDGDAALEGEAIARRILRDDRYATARGRLVDDSRAAAAATHAIPSPRCRRSTRPTATPPRRRSAALEAELDRIGEPHPALELGLRWLRAQPARPGRARRSSTATSASATSSSTSTAWSRCSTGSCATPATRSRTSAGCASARGASATTTVRPRGCGSRDELLAAYAAGGRARGDPRRAALLGGVRQRALGRHLPACRPTSTCPGRGARWSARRSAGARASRNGTCWR